MSGTPDFEPTEEPGSTSLRRCYNSRGRRNAIGNLYPHEQRAHHSNIGYRPHQPHQPHRPSRHRGCKYRAPQVELLLQQKHVQPLLDFLASRRIRMLLLVGVPCSGKSTLATALAACTRHLLLCKGNLDPKQRWMIANQDALGNRRNCEEVAREVLVQQFNHLKPSHFVNTPQLARPGAFQSKPSRARRWELEGGRLVVDRCNSTASQRAVWTKLARDCGLTSEEIGVVHLDTSLEDCKARVMSRKGHPTLPPSAKSVGVINGFAEGFELPTEREGFLADNILTLDGLTLEVKLS